MKKHRLTKITIITREIVSFSRHTSNEIHDSTIPVGPVEKTLLLPPTVNLLDTENENQDLTPTNGWHKQDK